MIGPGGVLMAQGPTPTYQPMPAQRQPINYTTAAGDGLASSQVCTDPIKKAADNI